MNENKEVGKTFWDVASKHPKIIGGLSILALCVLTFLLYRREVKAVGPIEFFPPNTHKNNLPLTDSSTQNENQILDETKAKEKVQIEFDKLLLSENYEIDYSLISPNAEIEIQKYTNNGSRPVTYQLVTYLDLIKIKKNEIKLIRVITVGFSQNNQVNSISLQQIDNE